MVHGSLIAGWAGLVVGSAKEHNRVQGNYPVRASESRYPSDWNEEYNFGLQTVPGHPSYKRDTGIILQ